jgi:hypothetical protein
MKKKEPFDIEDFFIGLWIVSWFVAIWWTNKSFELFLTGLFSLLLMWIGVVGEEEGEK